VVECASVTSPALCGCWRPRLLLPPGFGRQFSARELQFVFLHELAHVRRRDLWLNWLVAGLQVVHWFNPLLWFGFARWRMDRELACDALALEAAGEGQKGEYGRTILHLLESLTHRTVVPGLVGILEEKRQLQRRLRLIASFRPGQRYGWLAAALIAVLALAGLTDAQTTKSKDAAPPVSPVPAAAATDTLPGALELRVGADPGPETASTNAELRTLTVTVLDAATGMPLSGAEVFAPGMGPWRQPHPRRLTDEQGRYTLWFPPVPAEHRRQATTFSVSATSANHAQRTITWTCSAGDVHAGMPAEVTLKLEEGISIGGVVQDERGQPLPGVRVLLSGSNYRGFTMSGIERKAQEYAEVARIDQESPAAVTDATGRWSFPRFPSDLEQVEVTFARPEGSRETFATSSSDNPFRQRPLISLAELESQTAVTRLRDGVRVRGICVDEAGRPLGGVTVKEGYGFANHQVRVGEFITGADGRFERPHRAPRQWIYTASRADRATVSVVAQVELGMGEVRLVLPPAKPVRLRVVDEAGQPVPDAEFTLDNLRTEAQILDWTAKADTEGNAVWPNAPTARVTLYVSAKSLGATRKIRLTPGETERRIVLSKRATERIRVRVKAVDAATRQPVEVRSVSAKYLDPISPLKQLKQPDASEFSVEIRQADLPVGMSPSYRLKLDADGHESLMTEEFDFAEGDQELELALAAVGGGGEIIVLQPDGTPAAGAELWVRETTDSGILVINAPGRYHGGRLTQAQASEPGRIKLPGTQKEAAVVLTHASGFLETTMAALRRNGSTRLEAYGTVEGQLLVAGTPKSNASVGLTTLVWSPARAFHLAYIQSTGPDGWFVFTQVPPGDYKLYRWPARPARGGMGRMIVETYQMPVTVRAGQTNRLDYASTGRAVVGQVTPEPADLAVDWQNDDHVLELKLPAVPASLRPNYEDYATGAAFRKANEESRDSAARVAQAKAARTYPLVFEADGSFRVEDVPPGTYELRLRVTQPGEGQPSGFARPADELGSLLREVVVPGGEEPLDLGMLVLALKDDSGVKKTAPMDLILRTFEGSAVTLADHRGKPLLLVCWAAWSERSLEALAEVRKLEAELSSPAGLGILGLNVDDDAEAAKRVVQDGGYGWLQTQLDADTRTKALAALDVNTLPAIFLLDAEGRIVNRDLEGDWLRAAVRRALQRK